MGKTYILLVTLFFYGIMFLFLGSDNYIYDKTSYVTYGYSDPNSTQSYNDFVGLRGDVGFRQCTFFDSINHVWASFTGSEPSQCGELANELSGGLYEPSANTIYTTSQSSSFFIDNILFNIEGLGWLNVLLFLPLFLVLTYIILSSFRISIFGFSFGGAG